MVAILRTIWNLVKMELLSLFRDQRTFIQAILIPCIFYPFMMWLISAALMQIDAKEDTKTVYVAPMELVIEVPWMKEALLQPDKTEKGGDWVVVSEKEFKEILEEPGKTALFLDLEKGEFSNESLLKVRYPDDNIFAEGDATLLLNRLKRSFEAYQDELNGPVKDSWSYEWEGTTTKGSLELSSLIGSLILPSSIFCAGALAMVFPLVETVAGKSEGRTMQTLAMLPIPSYAHALYRVIFVAIVMISIGFVSGFSSWLVLRGTVISMLSSTGYEVSMDLTLVQGTCIVMTLVLSSSVFASWSLAAVLNQRTYKSAQAATTWCTLFIILSVLVVLFPELELNSILVFLPGVGTVLTYQEVLSQSPRFGYVLISWGFHVAWLGGGLEALIYRWRKSYG